MRVCRKCKRAYANKFISISSRECIHCRAERNWLEKYGLTPEAYIEMLNEQEGKCCICENDTEEILQVEHDHKTGIVRGLVCGNCNKMLGQAKDNPKVLRAGADYLEKNSEVF